ncbi:MAG TPA: NAD(P)/FAD-dependent oxidoreductase [Thermoleophilaceae bacterium]
MAPVPEYDVAIVGASIAGCTAAILYGRAGARVALIESHTDPARFKRVCTHYIQPSAAEGIERLGILPDLEAEGATRTHIDLWTKWGWVVPAEDDEPRAYNLRRAKLDPLLRRIASETEGVRLLLGESADGLLRHGARFAGVRTKSRDGSSREITARLVVGADGRDSKVGELAGIPAKVSTNNRFGYYANFSGVKMRRPGVAQMYLLDPDVAYAFPTDDELTTVALFMHKERLAEFKADMEGTVRRLFDSLPEGPRLDGAERETPWIGKLEMPNLRRRASAPAIAFIGDAALAADPLWGVGCGFAFQSATWLVDATADAVHAEGDLDDALKRYRKRHTAGLAAHHRAISTYSTGRRMNLFERALFSAATRDLDAARHMRRYGDRRIVPKELLAPSQLAHMVRVNLRYALTHRNGAEAAGAQAGASSQ